MWSTGLNRPVARLNATTVRRFSAPRAADSILFSHFLLLIAYYVIDIETSGGWQEGWGTLQPQCLYLTEKKNPN